MNQHEEKAREIALWLYGPDEGMSEGLVRTLIDKITEALAAAEKKGREERYILKAEIDQAWNEAITAAVKILLKHGYNWTASKIEALRKG